MYVNTFHLTHKNGISVQGTVKTLIKTRSTYFPLWEVLALAFHFNCLQTISHCTIRMNEIRMRISSIT